MPVTLRVIYYIRTDASANFFFFRLTGYIFFKLHLHKFGAKEMKRQ